MVLLIFTIKALSFENHVFLSTKQIAFAKKLLILFPGMNQVRVSEDF